MEHHLHPTREINIDADAVERADAGSFSQTSDCDGDSVSEGNYYLVYICEMDKSTSSKSVLATTTVTLTVQTQKLDLLMSIF